MTLFWRLFLINAAILITATVLLVLGPITVSTPVVLTEVLILAGGLAVMLAANAVLLRVGLAPIKRLTKAMATLDLSSPRSYKVIVPVAAWVALMTAYTEEVLVAMAYGYLVSPIVEWLMTRARRRPAGGSGAGRGRQAWCWPGRRRSPGRAAGPGRAGPG